MFPAPLLGRHLLYRFSILPITIIQDRADPQVPLSALVEILILTGLMFLLSQFLNRLVAKAAARRVLHRWIPWASSLVFGLLVSLCHFAAWIPIEIAAAAVLPCILLPPLIYCVAGKKSFPDFLPVNSEQIPFFQKQALKSAAIQRFRERYPQASLYLYQSRIPQSGGGVLLHNREGLNLPKPTWLEVTLNCPFAEKPGIFAEGQEILCAYLSRPQSGGSIVSILPVDTWELWLRGMENREWLQFLQKLDDLPPTYPPLENLPFQFFKNETQRQVLSLPREEKSV